jgi:hypothetical protein
VASARRATVCRLAAPRSTSRSTLDCGGAQLVRRSGCACRLELSVVADVSPVHCWSCSQTRRARTRYVARFPSGAEGKRYGCGRGMGGAAHDYLPSVDAHASRTTMAACLGSTGGKTLQGFSRPLSQREARAWRDPSTERGGSSVDSQQLTQLAPEERGHCCRWALDSS